MKSIVIHIYLITSLLIALAISPILASNQTLLVPTKQNYNIGGFSAGTPETLIQKFGPLFETYLSQQVGALYDPPISFSLIPVDFDANSTSQHFLNAGLLDFVCKCYFVSNLSVA